MIESTPIHKQKIIIIQKLLALIKAMTYWLNNILYSRDPLT